MNPKKLFHLFVLLFAASFIFTACNNDERVTGVTLNRSTLELTVGGSETLIATITPADATNRSVAWTSSDSEVASVINGTVTALSVGTTTITVITADGAHTATANVTVVSDAIAVTGVTLDRNTLQLNVGASETLTATIAPTNATNQTIAWTSSNSAVATVNNGTVTAVSAGIATITVITADGAHTAAANVTVTPATVAVTGVTLNYGRVDMWVNTSVTLTATVLPANATNRNVIWSSSNTQIATVSNTGVITGLREGTATITVTTVDGNRTANSIVTVFGATTDPGIVINGIRWAMRNVDRPGTFASRPQSFGMFYQWNRNVGWSATNPMVNSNGGTSWNSTTPGGTSWTVANNPCPPGWRVPTQAELSALNNLPNVWGTLGGVAGRGFGTFPNQVFLPAADGRGRLNGNLGTPGVIGYYWSSTQSSSFATAAWGLRFDNSRSEMAQDWHRGNAFSVRCVAEQSASAFESRLYQPQISTNKILIFNEIRTGNGLTESWESETRRRELQISAP